MAAASGFLLSTTKYLTRLGLDPVTFGINDDSDNAASSRLPSLAKLQQLQESHLARIPFENLAQHGCRDPAVLDVDATAQKILDCQRGGFCFELNSLFGTFLRQLGYTVHFVLAHVHRGGDTGYADDATHVILIVEATDEEDDDDDATRTTRPYYVDVGFGEPPLHPLDYTLFDKEQQTPEGMKSKLVLDGDAVELYWLQKGTWQPRLRWSYAASLASIEMADMAAGLAIVQTPEFIFSQKIITVRITRTTKQTLAGSRYKVTGPPRFQEDGSQGPKHVQQLSSALQAQELLEKEFAMPASSTSGLALEKSLAAAEEVWSNF